MSAIATLTSRRLAQLVATNFGAVNWNGNAARAASTSERAVGAAEARSMLPSASRLTCCARNTLLSWIARGVRRWCPARSPQTRPATAEPSDVESSGDVGRKHDALRDRPGCEHLPAFRSVWPIRSALSSVTLSVACERMVVWANAAARRPAQAQRLRRTGGSG